VAPNTRSRTHRRRPAGLPADTDPPEDPDAGATVSIPDPPPAPPLFASIAGSSRLVLRVTDQSIPYTTEGCWQPSPSST
jgi:hypothetical protein